MYNYEFRVLDTKDGYEILCDGYTIYGQGGEYGDYIPYPVYIDGVLDYAKSAQAHINELIQEMEQARAEAELERAEKLNVVTKEDLESAKLDILACLVEMSETMI